MLEPEPTLGGGLPAPTVPGGWGRPPYNTGLRDLDQLTRGIGAGELWFVIGARGQGRSTLLVQLTGQMACQHQLPTWLISDRDPGHMVSGRFHSRLALVPLQHIANDTVDPAEAERVTAATARLKVALLAIRAEPYARHRAAYDLRKLPPAARPAIALFDDPDWNSDWQLTEARELADAGMAVVVSVPRRCVINGPAFRSDLHPVAELAEVVLEVRHENLPAVDIDPGHDQPGCAAITILRNRQGPARTLTVAFQGHYARFVDREVGTVPEVRRQPAGG